MSNLLLFLISLHTSTGLEGLIRSGGMVALTLIIFSETGLLVGFFLPGDSLLVTAGVLASRNLTGTHTVLSIYELNIALTFAVVAGDQLGFLLGRKTGPKIFDRPDNRFFKKKYASEAHDFYEKHGGKAIVLARFVPIMRTFVPFIGGVAKMPYKRFFGFSVLGGIVWVPTLTTLGYFIGRSPLGTKLHLIILTVVFISLFPMLIGTIRKLARPGP